MKDLDGNSAAESRHAAEAAENDRRFDSLAPKIIDDLIEELVTCGVAQHCGRNIHLDDIVRDWLENSKEGNAIVEDRVNEEDA